MNLTDIIRIALIAYILYNILTLKNNKVSKNNKKQIIKEDYYPKLLNKGDTYYTRAKDRQNYKVDNYFDKITNKQKNKVIEKAAALDETKFFRPNDADNVHYPLQRNFDLHEIMEGKCMKDVDVKDIHRKLTEFKIEKLKVKNSNKEHVNDNNHNNVQSFTIDHVKYENDSPLTTGIIEGAGFTAFDADAQNIESVQNYYQNIDLQNQPVCN